MIEISDSKRLSLATAPILEQSPRKSKIVTVTDAQIVKVFIFVLIITGIVDTGEFKAEIDLQ